MIDEDIKIPNGKFLIIGCGSIGRRHLSNLMKLGIKNIIAFDVKKEQREEIRELYNIEVFENLETAIQQGVNVTIICSPTSFHLNNALTAAKHNCDIFIEKPVSDSLKDLDILIKEIKKRKLVTLVGCNFRFHPGLQKVKSLINENKIGRLISARAQFGQYLPNWHPWEDYRDTYSAKEKLGGGVLLDRIHEIDYIRWLLGEVKEVYAVMDHISSLEIETEDVAEIILRFTNNSVASIHLDYIKRTYDCSLEIVGEDGFIQWNLQDKKVCWYDAKKEIQHTIEWINYDINQMYIDEMKHLLRVIKRQENSELPVDDATRVLEVALAAKKAAIERKVVSI